MKIPFERRLKVIQGSLFALTLAFNSAIEAEIGVRGRVLDISGQALPRVQVTLSPGQGGAGPTALTVFTDNQGHYAFPGPLELNNRLATLNVRALGYRQTTPATLIQTSDSPVVILMTPSANQAGVAPASAWMQRIHDPVERNELVMSCVGCHQFPAPEVRHYAGMLHSYVVTSAEPAMLRKQAWHSIFKYMNYLATEEIGRGAPAVAAFDTRQAYTFSLGKRDSSALLSKYITGPLQHLEGYDFGVPLAVTTDTVIREYEVPAPNAIREAALMGKPAHLWVADFDSNRLIRIDPVSGAQKIVPVPAEVFTGPHTFHPGQDHHLWLAPQFNGIVGRLNTITEEWRLWELKGEQGQDVGIHDMTFDWRHELVTDTRGRIWFSDTNNNAVGFFDPETGETGSFPAPEIDGRPGKGANMYGIVMTADRQHIWYSQLGIGAFGSFNTETLAFEELVLLPEMNAGPRRLAISKDDILYIALFGAGQIVEYDTRARKVLGTYDLPDRASAPYSVTWDALRRAVWVATSNANAIYRFDPADKSFSVLPLPREGAFLRMLLVDPNSGHLVTSYANLPKRAHGPRMAVLIDPGDDVPGAGTQAGARRP